MSTLTATEVCTYTLVCGGKPVGSQLLRTTARRGEVALEARLLLQGALGHYTVTQTSRLELPTLQSVCFSEITEARDGRRTFDLSFDAGSGLVRAVRRVGAQSDAADVPYVRPYSDPLGLLYRLRQHVAQAVAGDVAPTERVPMLGKDVLIERHPPTEVETALGVRRAFALILSPGPSYVYIDTAPPHPIVRLTQRLEGALLDAFLVRIAHEALPRESAREWGRARIPPGLPEVPEPFTPESPEHAPGARPARRRRRGGRRRRKETP
ncbi:conserved hypothetical protein [Truepera radiovictrix DSM 17093]|uniref:Uncharacterized protein n=2 Tax=Truepera TaxID=332248 RepID=D7CQY6_TRURR|nr:conserved hypothetical protein [Truepera radiovictrix DSM 17093]